jgi:HK97 family phage major capsid protein
MAKTAEQLAQEERERVERERVERERADEHAREQAESQARAQAEARAREIFREELAIGLRGITAPKRGGQPAPGTEPGVRRGGNVDPSTAARFTYNYVRHFQAAERRLGPARPTLGDRLAKGEAGSREQAQRLISWLGALAVNDRTAMREFAAESYRALGGQTMGEGGALVPLEFAQEVIEKLGDMTPFATTEFLRVIPMTSEREVVPRLTTRPKAGYRNENETGTTPAKVEPRWGQIELVAREAWLLVPVSNRWLQNINIAGVEYLIDLFAEALAELRTDKILNGSGAGEPEGVRTNAGTLTQAFTITNDQTRAKSVITVLHKVKAKYRAAGFIWVTSDRGLEILSGLQDTQGRFLLTQLMDEPFQRLRGKPLFVSESIPINLGGGSDETELVGGAFKYYAFGDRQSMEAATDQGGQYFEAGQTAVRVSEQYDGKVAQGDAFVRGTGLK